MTPEEIDSLISSRLAARGAHLTAIEVRQATSECKREIETDNVAHGQDRYKPFWNFVSDDAVSVFTVFTPLMVDIYVIQHPLSELTPLTNPIPMGDVGTIENMLKTQFGKQEPEITIDRGSAEFWLT